MEIEEKKVEIFKELINIGVGKASATLNQLLTCHVTLNVPDISILTMEEYIKNKVGNNDIYSVVKMNFYGPFEGSANLLFNQESASKLISALVGEEIMSNEMDELKTGTLSEVGNILLNSVMGSISNIIHDHFDFSVVEYLEGTFQNLLGRSYMNESILIVAETIFEVPPLNIGGQINIFMSLESFESMEQAVEKVI